MAVRHTPYVVKGPLQSVFVKAELAKQVACILCHRYVSWAVEENEVVNFFQGSSADICIDIASCASEECNRFASNLSMYRRLSKTGPSGYEFNQTHLDASPATKHFATICDDPTLKERRDRWLVREENSHTIWIDLAQQQKIKAFLG